MDNKTIKANIIIDEPLDALDPGLRFFTLFGKCKKCNIANTSLIVTTFLPNNKDKKQSIFRTICLNCFDKSMYFGHEIKKDVTDGKL
jgi:hypothetical protein